MFSCSRDSSKERRIASGAKASPKSSGLVNLMTPALEYFFSPLVVFSEISGSSNSFFSAQSEEITLHPPATFIAAILFPFKGGKEVSILDNFAI
ncbi:MAG: hypothetical protein DDT41_01647 [candidate division WS2 bacterium]|nr:hypothetical protein [Candidatus Psychracetigena formicireducens]